MSDPILAAAGRLLAQGPDALTMDALAREAGVSRATLYRLAGSREQILARLGAAEAPDARQRILDAARAVFARQGLEGATIEAVAREAGVGTVTVYRHFGGKAGLITAFAREAAPARRIAEVAVPTEDARADVHRVAAALAASLAQEADLLRVVLGEACRTSEWLEQLRHRPVRGTQLIAGLLQHHMDAGRLRHTDPVLCARSLFGMLLAHLFVAPLLDGTPVPDAAATAAHVAALLLDGLTPPPGSPA